MNPLKNLSLFSHRALAQLKTTQPKKRRSLDELSQYINFEYMRPVLEELCDYSKGAGRPPYDVILMLKILILQTLYNLSDEEMEFQLNDRVSFMRFCGIEAYEKIPDSRTMWLFRERIGDEGCKQLFDHFHQYMVEAGLRYSGGTIVDASFVEAPRQRNSKEENEEIKNTSQPISSWSKNKARHKDVEAKWTRKDHQNYFGYKQHASADIENKILIEIDVTPANVADNKAYEKLIGQETLILLADKAYISEEQKKSWKKKGVILLHPYRKKNDGKDLTAAQKQYNKKISAKRGRIEHIFGTISQMGGDRVRSIGLKRCKIKVALVSLLYNMRRFGFLCRTGQLCPQIS